jgi:hypothetical protein
LERAEVVKKVVEEIASAQQPFPFFFSLPFQFGTDHSVANEPVLRAQHIAA